MPSHSAEKRKVHSMYPSHHPSVVELLEPFGIEMDFHPVDTDETPCETRMLTKHTNIMGVFSCYNKSCPSHGWASKMVAVTIRMYCRAGKGGIKQSYEGKGEGGADQPGLYNVRVYHQRCKKCNFLSRPKLDETYAERVAYHLKRWHGVKVERPVYVKKSKAPHARQFCEGCKAGVCRYSTSLNDDSD
ncbi:3CxxC-type zinc finger protein [Aspergillus foveolatus]|uniref:3CxxC-type zinc finger protein n=1 Tax=Aspergillus foveolatus TaxID=210207 RepID=UPI003CCE3FF5